MTQLFPDKPLEAFLKTPLAVARLRRSWDIVA